jgi:hypothetical protein
MDETATVLAVYDGPLNLRLLLAFLEPRGYGVLWVGSGLLAMYLLSP